MTSNPPSWRTTLALAALSILPFLLPRPSDADTLLARLLGGDCEALPVLARHHPQALDLELYQTIASHPDPLLRELAAHQAWTPHIALSTQLEVVGALQPPALRERALLWLSRRTTSQKTLTLADIDSYWSTRDS